MNTLTRRLLATSAALLLAGATATAMARGPGGCDAGPEGPRAEQMQQRMANRMAQREAQLKTALKLTADQETAWTAFTNAMKPLAMAGKTRPNREDMAQLTTPQRLEKMQAMKAEHDARMTQRIEATKTFYAALTPEQQKVFDAQGPGPGGRSSGHPGHGGPRMPHG